MRALVHVDLSCVVRSPAVPSCLVVFAALVALQGSLPFLQMSGGGDVLHRSNLFLGPILILLVAAFRLASANPLPGPISIESRLTSSVPVLFARCLALLAVGALAILALLVLDASGRALLGMAAETPSGGLHAALASLLILAPLSALWVLLEDHFDPPVAFLLAALSVSLGFALTALDLGSLAAPLALIVPESGRIHEIATGLHPIPWDLVIQSTAQGLFLLLVAWRLRRANDSLR